MFATFKNKTTKTIIIILSLFLTDANPISFNQQGLESNHTSEYTIIEKCFDCVYATILNLNKRANTDENSCEDEDSIEIDDHIVIALTMIPPHQFNIHHLTPLAWPIVKDIYIEVISPPPLLSV